MRTFLQTFVALTIPGVLGFLADLTGWANSHGQLPFPDYENLSYLLVTATTSALVAVVTALWTKTEDVSGHALLRTLPASKPGD